MFTVMSEPSRHLPTSASASTLRTVAVTEATIDDWRHVHNVVIPAAPLTRAEVQERIARYLLTVAYAGDCLIGCTTVRPPDDVGTVTVIVRVLPEHRGRGYGQGLFVKAMEAARGLGGSAVETIVLASNVDGLRFALRHGFVEVSRYLLPEDDVPFITLRLE